MLGNWEGHAISKELCLSFLLMTSISVWWIQTWTKSITMMCLIEHWDLLLCFFLSFFRKEYNNMCWVCTLSEATTCKSHPHVCFVCWPSIGDILTLQSFFYQRCYWGAGRGAWCKSGPFKTESSSFETCRALIENS